MSSMKLKVWANMEPRFKTVKTSATFMHTLKKEILNNLGD